MRRRLMAVLVLSLLVLAACGSDDDDDGGGGDATEDTSSSGGDVRGVTADEIRVGGLGDSASFFIEDTVGLGARARFERANAEGEVPGGRKINLVAWGDIKADAATGVQEMRRLVDRERVFAIVPNVSAFTPADVAVLLVEEHARNALDIADTIAVMDLGRIVWCGPRDEADLELLATSYLGGAVDRR